MKNRLISALAFLGSFLPTPLPRTPAQFDAWAASILKLGGLPENDSFRNALATRMMHVNETTTLVPKRFFVNVLCKSISNQLAYQVIEDIRNKRKQEQAELEAKAL